MVANGNLNRNGYNNANLFLGDGHNGLSQFAPYDAIIVTCCAKEIPDKLLSQLKVGGRMVIPIENTNSKQSMFVVERTGESEYVKSEIGECNFVPMLEGIVKQAAHYGADKKLNQQREKINHKTIDNKDLKRYDTGKDILCK